MGTFFWDTVYICILKTNAFRWNLVSSCSQWLDSTDPRTCVVQWRRGILLISDTRCPFGAFSPRRSLHNRIRIVLKFNTESVWKTVAYMQLNYRIRKLLGKLKHIQFTCGDLEFFFWTLYSRSARARTTQLDDSTSDGELSQEDQRRQLAGL